MTLMTLMLTMCAFGSPTPSWANSRNITLILYTKSNRSWRHHGVEGDNHNDVDDEDNVNDEDDVDDEDGDEDDDEDDDDGDVSLAVPHQPPSRVPLME